MGSKIKNKQKKKKLIAVFAVVGILALALVSVILIKVLSDNNRDNDGGNESYCTVSNDAIACRICIPEAFGVTPYYFVEGVDLRCCVEFSNGQIWCQNSIPVPNIDKLCPVDCRIY